MYSAVVSPTISGSCGASPEMYIRDWRKALRSPPSYRIGNTTFRFHFHYAFMVFCLATLVILFLYVKPASRSTYSDNWLTRAQVPTHSYNNRYNYTYPISSPIISNGMQTFRIGLIADMDKDSKVKDAKNTWRSYYKKGYISFTKSKESIVVSFDQDEPTELLNGFALSGRGMELSELVTFNGRLLTFDDRTGFVYELNNDKVIPWVVLMDGDGHSSSKGFKSEWATVKDDVLYVGSMGKEWTTDTGEFQSYDPMYVKVISMAGEVYHINWVENYKKIRSAIGISWPGYMIHESAMWSTINRRWYFLPRRCSKEIYNDTQDEYKGCNVLISAEENFTNVNSITLGTYKPTHGFSSFKFLPGSEDKIIVALQTEELTGSTKTFITAFTIDGRTLLAPQQIETKLKYEGLEFI